MLQHHFKKLAIGAAVAASLLLPIGSAFAGKGGGGGGHGGGGHAGGGHPSGGHPGGGHPSGGHPGGHPGNHPGGHPGGNHNNNGNHWNNGWGWGGGLFLGVGLYPGYYDTWGYSSNYYDPGYYYDQGMPPAPTYAVPDTAYQAPQRPPALDPNAVYVDLSVPDANAEVWINGVKTDQKGVIRPFVSPALTPGKSYTYEFKVQWKQGNEVFHETREISVRAGDRFKLNFTASAPAQPKQISGEISATKDR